MCPYKEVYTRIELYILLGAAGRHLTAPIHPIYALRKAITVPIKLNISFQISDQEEI